MSDDEPGMTAIALRVRPDWLQRADDLVPALARSYRGVLVTRAVVLREALAIGLQHLEAERERR